MKEIFRGFSESFRQGLEEGFFDGMASNERTPAEKSKAQQVEREILAEASRLLEDKDEVIIDQGDIRLSIETERKLREEKAFNGADLLISSLSRTNAYVSLELYAFYREGVRRYIARPRPNGGADVKNREASARDLKKLLKQIRGSQSRK